LESNINSPIASTSALDESTPTETFNSETKLRLFLDYKNKKTRLNINVPMKMEAKVESDRTNRQIDECRSISIQAAIVRIMKMRLTLNQERLVAEVIAQLASRFKPDVKTIRVSCHNCSCNFNITKPFSL